jgi:hypothetical protein
MTSETEVDLLRYYIGADRAYRPQSGDAHEPVNVADIQNGTVWLSWLSTYMVQWIGNAGGERCWQLLAFGDSTANDAYANFCPVSIGSGQDSFTKQELAALLDSRLCKRVPMHFAGPVLNFDEETKE